MKKILFVVLAIFIYGAFLVALTPARFALSLLPLPENIKLGAVSGTVWSGKATSVQMDSFALEALTWQVMPSKLFGQTLAANIWFGNRGSDIVGKGKIGATTEIFSISDLTLKTNISYLTSLAPLPMGMSASGNLSIDAIHFAYSQPWCDTLEAKVIAKDAIVGNEMGQVPIKLASIDLHCEQGSLVATAESATNSLGIDAIATLSSHYELAVNGTIMPPGDAPKLFVQLLEYGIEADEEGRYPIDFREQLN